jgi:hypothetical protein
VDRKSAILAFLLAAALTAALWAFSVPLTGKAEAWDAEAYYFAALVITGAISGAIIPKHLPAHYLGAMAGQVAYEVVFLESGALFILGLAFMAAFAVIFLGAAAVGATLRKRARKVSPAS